MLLRRADHEAVRRALFPPVSGESSSYSAQHHNCWPLFLALQSTETNVVVLSHSYALLLVCAGTFRSSDALREYLSAAAPFKRENVNSSSTSVAILSFQWLWRSQWNWNTSLEGVRAACERDITTLLHPLLLSVHPTQRSMSSILLKPGSSRAATTLQQLWTKGVEFALAMLQTGASPSFCSTLLSASLSSFSFSLAFRTYVTATLDHFPFIVATEGALWRMIELIFELFLRKDGKEEEMKESTTMWMLLSTCFKELSSDRAEFDPYFCGASSSSPYLSLTSLLFRFIKLLLDDTSRSVEITRLWETLPIIQVLCFQVLMFDCGGDRGTERARSQLVQDAEYIITRRYFDSKHISKILPLICCDVSSSSSSAASASGFISQIALYLPPGCEQLLKAQKNAPFAYRRDGLNSSLKLIFAEAPLAASPSSSLLPSTTSLHFLMVILNLLKKYLLFATSDAVGGASSTLSSGVAAGSTVRAVRDMQQEKLTSSILSTLSRVLSDHTLYGGTHDRCVSVIQTTFLEFYLWNVRRSVRVKEVFDLARRLQSKSGDNDVSLALVSAKISGADTLFGLGVRVLLCLVDAITTCMQQSPPSSGLLDAPAGTSSSGHSPRSNSTSTALANVAVSSFTQVWAENIGNLVQDVAQILNDWKDDSSAQSSESNGTNMPLQISDVFDLTYQTSQLVPPRIHRVAELYTIVLQVHAFFVSVAPRFALLSTPSLSASAAQPLLSPTAPSPAAPLISPIPPSLSSPVHRRPFSSYSRVEGGSSAAASRSSAPRAPSYSPPSSSNGGGLGGLSNTSGQGGGLQGILLSPRSIRSVAAAQLTSSEAGSLTVRTPRHVRLTSAATDSTLRPLAPSLPRPTPPSHPSPRNPALTNGSAPHLKPLSGGTAGKVATPIAVVKASTTQSPTAK